MKEKDFFRQERTFWADRDGRAENSSARIKIFFRRGWKHLSFPLFSWKRPVAFSLFLHGTLALFFLLFADPNPLPMPFSRGKSASSSFHLSAPESSSKMEIEKPSPPQISQVPPIPKEEILFSPVKERQKITPSPVKIPPIHFPENPSHPLSPFWKKRTFSPQKNKPSPKSPSSQEPSKKKESSSTVARAVSPKTGDGEASGETSEAKTTYLAKYYPSRCRRRGHEGKVILKAWIDSQGNCQQVEVISSEGCPDLVEAAQESARDSRFLPALERGKPVGTWKRLVYVFSLE